jgi:ferric-dicitrate binding protein FerR (iron transport regulator)
VFLTGEADFSVAPSTDVPFIVKTGTIVTQVLGTVFNVRHYEECAAVQVAVRSGRVLTGTAITGRVVSAGESARVTDSATVVGVLSDVGQYTDWSQGQLVFRATPVPEFLATVGRWYGYRFVLADSALAHGTVTVRLNVADSTEMWATLTGLLDVEPHFADSAVTLIPRQHRETGARSRLQTHMRKPSMEMGR